MRFLWSTSRSTQECKQNFVQKKPYLSNTIETTCAPSTAKTKKNQLSSTSQSARLSNARITPTLLKFAVELSKKLKIMTARPVHNFVKNLMLCFLVIKPILFRGLGGLISNSVKKKKRLGGLLKSWQIREVILINHVPFRIALCLPEQGK